MKKPNIVFVGHVVIDRNKVEQTSYVHWGSPAMFMSTYFQTHFGITPTIVASYGQDFLPFREHVSLLPSQPNLEHSTVYENIVVAGHRTQYCHHGNASLPPITKEIEAVLRTADILFLAPLAPTFSADYVERFMSFVPKECLTVLSPQGYLRHITRHDLVRPREFSEAAHILPYFKVMILSDEDHPEAVRRAHDWKSASPHTDIIVTLNARGADIIEAQGEQCVPTTPVPLDRIIDSTGLGDIFSAAVALHLYRHDSLTQAIQSGHLATREKLLQR